MKSHGSVYTVPTGSDRLLQILHGLSAHGIPRAYVSQGLRRTLWLLLFFFCFCAFGYQAYLIVLRFSRNDIIVGVEIKFEEIRFPAVTICNINPYKNSLARQTTPIKHAIESFEYAIDRSSGSEISQVKRKKRATNRTLLKPAHVYCRKSSNHYTIDPEGNERCICSTFSNNEYYWNCAPEREYQTTICPNDTNIESLSLCYCQGGFCIEAENQVKIVGRWPLSLSIRDCYNSSSCMCVVLHTNDISLPSTSYCANISDWQLTMCNGCDWWGRCTRSFGLVGDEECVCDGESYTSCFAVESDNDIDNDNDDSKKHVRVRRDKQRVYEKILSQHEGIMAVYAMCECNSERGCFSFKKKYIANTSTECVCFYNKNNDQIWPCYRQEEWEERKCSRCNSFGDCHFSASQTNAIYDCYCALPIRMCVRIDPSEGNITDLTDRIVNVWEILPTTTMSPNQKKEKDREKAYGYTGVTDPITLKGKAMENIIFAVDQLTETEKWAISYKQSEFITKCSFNGKECKGVTDPITLKGKAMENIIFAVDQLTETEKWAISYKQSEFITKCSFNGKECKVEDEFKAYLDPSYGACFTYVGSHYANITSERAGPSYGLRLEVFVNISEYLPTTEAAGVRLTVHSFEEQPFPDTLGHSAPTGFISSFGIRMKTMSRLPLPYGDCNDQGKDDDFIYVDKKYNTEGCQRSCIQKHLVTRCGCGDPRYPPYRSIKNCPVDDLQKRQCLKREINYATRYSKKIGCKCKQPCSQDVYTVSYSASRWPAVPGDQSGCPNGMAAHHCFMEQGAMIEVYFEQLNYESLLESEAYGLPNLLSDFGGQLGLWMGVSVITIMEVFILLLDVLLTIFGLTAGKGKPYATKKVTSSIHCNAAKE
ncbi:degenerin [Dictyocaulus viviparus]|uniref:Degenerin n=1 Tax=Dictyocaulus viviparus TaxID=29172 RepID=A0A0D8Y1P2_DICVI|nr:degenerin [Dictyocaulus viviparus]